MGDGGFFRGVVRSTPCKMFSILFYINNNVSFTRHAFLISFIVSLSDIFHYELQFYIPPIAFMNFMHLAKVLYTTEIILKSKALGNVLWAGAE